MHTIQPPSEFWGLLPESARFAKYPPRINGKKIPGWTDVNISLLARDMGVSYRYLLAVLCGQRNCTLALLQKTAQALGIELTTLIDRMERAYNLRCLEAEKVIPKTERRKARATRRAVAAKGTYDE